MSISIRNRLPGTIEKITSDKVASEVVIRTAAGNATSIIYYNDWFGVANETQRGRYRFCDH